MDRLRQNLRTETALVIRENADVRRQIAINLHEPQSGKTVEPGIGHFLHDLLVAFGLDAVNQCLTLTLLYARQQMVVDCIRVRITKAIGGHTIHSGPLGDSVN